MKKLLNYLYRILANSIFRSRAPRGVVLQVPEPLSPESMVTAFSVSDKQPLWRAINYLLDDAITAKLTDAVDPESGGEENAFRRGEANALLEIKARLIDFKVASTEANKES